MNSPFIINARKLHNRIAYSKNDQILDHEIRDLEKMIFNLVQEIQSTIINHPEIGKNSLIANINEIDKEYKFIESNVKFRLRELMEESPNSYEQYHWNLKELVSACEDAIAYLCQLLSEFFPQIALKNKTFYEKYEISNLLPKTVEKSNRLVQLREFFIENVDEDSIKRITTKFKSCCLFR